MKRQGRQAPGGGNWATAEYSITVESVTENSLQTVLVDKK